MSGQIKFYKKNHIDLDRPNPELSVTDNVATSDGASNLNLVRNRNNNSGWMTTGSSDAAETQILVELKDYQTVDVVMLIKHNFSDFTIEYWNASAAEFQDFQAVTDNSKDTNILKKSVSTNQIRLTIHNTQTVDADKTLRQLIIAENFAEGTFEGYPQIKKPTTSLNKQVNKLLGGRVNVVEKSGSFSVSLDVNFLVIDNDLSLIENLYFSREGVLMLLSGGDEDQFATKRMGYRNEDIVLVRPTNELQLPYVKGTYSNGIKIKMDLQEVVY